MAYYRFINGAKWADSNPNPELKKQWLEKVCEWIEDNVDDKYIHFTLDGCRDPEILSYKISEDFRKYMEEQP